MKRGAILAVFGLFFGSFATAETPQSIVAEVYKSPTSRCCSRWIDYLRQNGLTVRTVEMPDAQLPSFKTKHGVPPQARSCHTALVDGYAIEGHVPAADIRRLLKERPGILGLAVGGMPRGAPGMEVWGAKPQPYDVTAFDKRGSLRLFTRYGR